MAGTSGVPQGTRVLIYTSSGDGHRSAARAIEAYFQAHCPKTVHVRTVDFMAKHTPSLDTLTRLASDPGVDVFPAARGTFSDLTDRIPQNPVVHELMAGGFAHAEAYVRAFRPDAVISTHPVPGAVASELKGSTGLLAATVVTDYGGRRLWLHPDTDLYFVPTTEMRDDFVVAGLTYDRLVVSGIPIDERFSQSLSRRSCRAALGLEDRFTVLLVAAGTVDDVRSLARSLAGAGVQVAASCGHDERLYRALLTLADKQPLLHAFGASAEMPAMMRAADVAVGTAGGQTAPEAFALGVPLIMLEGGPGLPSHDVSFLATWGAGLEAHREEDVLEAVRFLASHPKRLAQLASDAATLGRPTAARVVCERVLAGLR
jgi:processive 1,2-diacylglycerol beta-glucosyltransferase